MMETDADDEPIDLLVKIPVAARNFSYRCRNRSEAYALQTELSDLTSDLQRNINNTIDGQSGYHVTVRFNPNLVCVNERSDDEQNGVMTRSQWQRRARRAEYTPAELPQYRMAEVLQQQTDVEMVQIAVPPAGFQTASSTQTRADTNAAEVEMPLQLPINSQTVSSAQPQSVGRLKFIMINLNSGRKVLCLIPEHVSRQCQFFGFHTIGNEDFRKNKRAQSVIEQLRGQLHLEEVVGVTNAIPIMITQRAYNLSCQYANVPIDLCVVDDPSQYDDLRHHLPRATFIGVTGVTDGQIKTKLRQFLS